MAGGREGPIRQAHRADRPASWCLPRGVLPGWRGGGQALVRDDAAVRTEIVTVVIEGELGIDPALVDVQVWGGRVTLRGSLDAARSRS
ncbi:hypothetical protein [Streptomyces sp. NPDC001137]|uniref:hypothetical protein n=1 Tax=Streptomyces sp. NPDC001137 TaxID=3154378 RepID=UPI00332BEF79